MGPRPQKKIDQKLTFIEPTPMVVTAGAAFGKFGDSKATLQAMVMACLKPRTKDLMAKALSKIGGKENPWPCGFDRAAYIALMVDVNAVKATADAKENGVIKDEKAKGANWQALRWALGIRASGTITPPDQDLFEQGSKRINAFQQKTVTDAKTGKERHFIRIPWGPRVMLPDGSRGPSAISIAASDIVDVLNACPAEPWRTAAIAALLMDVEDACGFDGLVSQRSERGTRVWGA